MGKIVNNKLHKYLSTFLATLLLFSLIPNTTWATGQNDESASRDSKVLLKVNEDVVVELVQEKGIIETGTLLFAEELDSNYKVQWNNEFVELQKDQAQEIIGNDMNELFTTFNFEKQIGTLTFSENVNIVSDEKETYYKIQLNAGNNYHVVNVTEETYQIILGNRMFNIPKIKSGMSFNELEDINVAVTEEQPTKENKSMSSENKVAESNKVNVKKLMKTEMKHKNKSYKTTNYGNYFKVINNEAIVFDNRTKDRLIEIGSLVKGQTYKRVSNYGNWHKIQYGSHYGYVHKKNTIAGSKNDIQNINTSYKSMNKKFNVDENVTVYDNTSGTLVPFAILTKGQVHEVASDYGNWFRILISDRVGYVNKEAVTEMFTRKTNFFKVTGDKVPVYDNRTGKLVKVGSLIKGQSYKRVSDYGNWHRIQYGDFYGYVLKSETKPTTKDDINNLNNSRYQNSNEKFIAREKAVVYNNAGGKLVPFAKIEKGTRFPIVSDYGNWYRVSISGRIGYIHKQDVTGYFTTKSKYFEVTKDGIPVYDNRQKGTLKKIGELKKGQVYERVSDYGNWHRIQFGNHYGYVHESGTIPSFKNEIPNYNSKYKNRGLAFTTREDAIVFDNTSGKLIPFAKIRKGEKHPIASDYGNWYRILIANKVGYINKDSVKLAFTNDMKYFRVNKSNLPIYDNRGGGPLEQVGTLVKGQTYKRVSDYGNWHRIQFGNYYGYVKKSNTEPSTFYGYKNRAKTDYSNGTLTPTKDVIVYDNTGNGSLTPFATLNKGEKYPVIRDYGNWYEINISGRYGYVHKSEVKATVLDAVDIVNPNQEYKYTDMRTDIIQLKKAYPGLFSWKSIGKSVDGRNIYAIKLGTGKKEVFFNGATHAREWITTNLLMEMIDVYSQAYVRNDSYGGYNVRKILNDTSIWFVPMVNPDGVSLVQLGAFSADNPNRVLQLNNGSTDFRAWKANIRGVDLNRQYPFNWDLVQNNEPYPGPENHKGKAPLTEPESRAIYNFSRNHDFKTAVAYHSSGEILYWGDTTYGSLHSLSRKIADKVHDKTGYSLMFTRGQVSGGTFTDWFQEKVKRPALTPEVSPYVGNRPVPISSFDSIWKENNTIGLMIAQEASTR